jgi:hypothetical protein
LVRHLGAGGGVVFATSTIPHNQGDSLSALFTGVTHAWANCLKDRTVTQWFGDNGVGFTRAAEVTHGVNGWHPHLHTAMVTKAVVSRAAAQELRAILYEPWCRGVEANGWRRPSPKYGLSVIRCDTAAIGGYVSKVEGLADELTRMDSKSAGKTEPPFSILRRAVAGDESAAVLWRQYEQGTKGRRALTYSAGLKARLGIGEVSDEVLSDPANSGWVLLGEVTGRIADELVRHPNGFQLFADTAADGTPEAWRAAIEVLHGSAPWWVRAEVEYLHRGVLLAPDPEVEERENVGATVRQEVMF